MYPSNITATDMMLFRSLSSLAIPLLLTTLPRVAVAQSTPQTTYTYTINVFPTGVANGHSTLDSTVPIPCEQVCFLSNLAIYSYVFELLMAACLCSHSMLALTLRSYCFVNSTLPNGDQFNTTFCDQQLCNNTDYTELTACFNCIVANGQERPYGYYTNTSLTVLPTQSHPTVAEGIYNPWGLLNTTTSNEILKNISDHCASVSSSITVATTVTATPTTT